METSNKTIESGFGREISRTHRSPSDAKRPVRPIWPALLDFYGLGRLLLSRHLSPAASAWNEDAVGAIEADEFVGIRLIGASSGEALLTLRFERESGPQSNLLKDSTFLDRDARLELANVIAGRLLDHPSPWGDHFEWCSTPFFIPNDSAAHPQDGFTAEYAFQDGKHASSQWWITATLERRSTGADRSLDAALEAPRTSDLLKKAPECSSS